MATIQCAIELYDGVSPVLQEMAVNLEGFSQQFAHLGGEMGEFAPDTQELLKAGVVLTELADKSQGAYKILEQTLEIGSQMAEVFSVDMFGPMEEGVEKAALTLKEMLPYAADTAEGMQAYFLEATETTGADFVRMQEEVYGSMNQIALGANAVAGSLPGFFAAPLNQIAAMFSGMAASAMASLNSITGASQRALGAMQAVGRNVPTATVAAFSVPGDGGASIAAFSVPSGGDLGLPRVEMMGQSENVPIAPMGAVTLHVQNENYISSDMDLEQMLEEMEVRLADAVAMSMEGVYA